MYYRCLDYYNPTGALSYLALLHHFIFILNSEVEQTWGLFDLVSQPHLTWSFNMCTFSVYYLALQEVFVFFMYLFICNEMHFLLIVYAVYCVTMSINTYFILFIYLLSKGAVFIFDRI